MTGAFSPKVVAPREGTTVKLFGVRFGYKVVSEDSAGRLAVLEVVIPPGTLVKPHSHAREDEFSLVLSGTVGVRTGDRVSEAGPGAYLVNVGRGSVVDEAAAGLQACVTPQGFLRLIPGAFGSDGFFVAVIERSS